MRPSFASLAAPLLALLSGMLCGSAVMLAWGASPARIWALLFATTWGNAYGLGQVLYKTTPLVLSGLSVALALRAGLFNIGCEGQIVAGSFLCALLGTKLGALPPVLAVSLCLFAAFAGGAAMGALPGWLKARTGSHEVIHTLMLNFIAQAAVVYLGGSWFLRETIHTAPVAGAARLPRLSTFVPALHGSAANLALVLALLCAGGVAWLLFGTRLGLELRAMGASPRAAAGAGVRTGALTVVAMALAGGLAGLVGANFVLGYKGYFEQGFSGGVGFLGIAVALLGRLRPAGVVLAALLLATLSQGALGIHALVPKETIDVLVAVMLVAAACDAPLRRLIAGGRR
jgi:general nucleoside transport system permease protein